ncbi:MAG: hypothetical protein HOI19_13655 [Rhodospirillaceae bacterium]|jgi:Spy/CpxP family protein refolding chaperone|nr:hypothetical protein [Rhodospirillaceae bacterium]
MRMITAIFMAALVFAPMQAFAAGSHTGHAGHKSSAPYAGQQDRAIKSLSAKDIDDLRNGRGWGFAKAAELNGVPGPVHLLELRTEIGLTPSQIAAIKGQFKAMKAKAVPLGKTLIEREALLERAFASGDIDSAKLKALLADIAVARRDLRFVHLATHLETPAILSPDQIKTYNRLRGY